MPTQLPWECFQHGVMTISPRESRRLIRRMIVDDNGVMQVDQLSAIVPFHVGNAVSSGSWGRRFRRKKSLNAKEGYWTAKDFQWEEQVGFGYFGEVYRANYLGREDPDSVRRSKQVAIKSLKKDQILQNTTSGSPALELIRREIAIHSSISHNSIAKLYGFYEDPTRFNLVMEYYPDGDLLDFMKRFAPASRKRNDVARKVLVEISLALSHLAELQCAHRDLKPENILVRRTIRGGHLCSTMTAASTFSCALTDFGWACWWEHGEFRRTLCGTLEYLPVEMIEGRCCYEAKYVDCWALGILAVELLTGKTPFAADDENSEDDPDASDLSERQAVYNKILAFQPESYFANNPLFPASDFCQRLLQRTPTKRMSAGMALEHAFLRPESASAIVTPMSVRRDGQCHDFH